MKDQYVLKIMIISICPLMQIKLKFRRRKL